MTKQHRGHDITIFNIMLIGVYILIYTNQQKKRYTNFFEIYFDVKKPKQLLIIIYVNVCMKRKTNNSILFHYGEIPESQFSVP
jgi:hypothetical protein